MFWVLLSRKLLYLSWGTTHLSRGSYISTLVILSPLIWPSIDFGAGPAGCWRHFGTVLNLTNEWAISHIWRCPVSHVNEACLSYAWVTSRMSHVPHMKESCHTYEWVVSHIWMSHVTHMNESCHTCNESCHTYLFIHVCEWVVAHIWMSHVTHMNESCHTDE